MMESPSDNEIDETNCDTASEKSNGGDIEIAPVLLSNSTHIQEDIGDSNAISIKD